MNRSAIILTAVITFGFAIAVLVLGQNLILSLPVSTARGARVPWFITWGMVWVTVLCAVTLGGFLIASTVRRK